VHSARAADNVADTPPVVADAAEALDTTACRRLLRSGADPNQPQPDGMTALHWAAWHNRAGLAQRLIDAGAEVQVENHYGIAPLAIACTNGHGRLVRVLLAAGADPNSRLPGEETALMVAARTGRPGPVKLLLAGGADLEAHDRKGQTALMWAAAEGHDEVVRLLLEAGASDETLLKSGFNALLFAVRGGHTPVVRRLLAAGADVNQTMQPQDTSPRKPQPGTSPLTLALENGHFELAVELLDAGADPNDSRDGYAPLHRISWIRTPHRGEGIDGQPPPEGSGALTSLEFVREVVARGADVNARVKRGKYQPARLNLKGCTPFLLAAYRGDLPLMQLLVELGADPTRTNADGTTPLLAAVGVGTFAPGEMAGTEPEALAILDYLLDLGADINAVDANGETAMHGAAYKNFPQVVAYLAEHGAKVEVWNQPNRLGHTPLWIARGYRPGNFRPLAETTAAVEQAMRAAGVEVPANRDRTAAK
jgi:ankyrin repeat protein